MLENQFAMGAAVYRRYQEIDETPSGMAVVGQETVGTDSTTATFTRAPPSIGLGLNLPATPSSETARCDVCARGMIKIISENERT